MCVLSLFGHVQPFVTLCSRLDSSVHGILQARILDWVSMLPSKGSSQPRGQTHFSYVSCIGSWDLTRSATWEAQTLKWSASKKLKKKKKERETLAPPPPPPSLPVFLLSLPFSEPHWKLVAQKTWEM